MNERSVFASVAVAAFLLFLSVTTFFAASAADAATQSENSPDDISQTYNESGIQNHGWAFPQGWSLPYNVSGNSDVWEGDVSIAIDSHNTAHVFWQDHNIVTPTIMYSEKTSTGRWTSPYSLPNAYNLTPQLLIGDDDALHLFWVGESGVSGGTEVLYAKRDDNGWGSPENVSNDPDHSKSSVVGVLDTNNDPHFVWNRCETCTSGDSGSYYSTKSAQGTWSVPQKIAAPPAYVAPRGYPFISDAQGNLHLILVKWYQNAEYLKKTAGGWSSPLQVYGCKQIEPWMAVDFSGLAHVISECYLGQGRGSGISYSTNQGGTWSEPYLISSGREVDFSGLALDDPGNLHVAWRDRASVVYNMRTTAGAWLTPTIVITSGGYVDYRLPITVDLHGTVHMIVQRSDYQTEELIYLQKPFGREWSSPVALLSSRWLNLADLQMFITQDGRIHVFWFWPEGRSVYYTSCLTNCTASTPDQPVVTSGFQLDQDAWSFENRGYQIAWDHLRGAFGPAAVENSDGSRRRFANFMFNQGIKDLGDNGLCYGMALSSGILYAPWNVAPPIPDYTATSAVPDPGYVPPSSASQPAMFHEGPVSDYLARYHLYQYSLQYKVAALISSWSSLEENVAQIKAAIDGNLQSPVLIALYGGNDACVGHTIVPYAYREVGDGIADVFVYDPVAPYSSTQPIQIMTFNESAKSWSYHRTVGDTQWENGQQCSIGKSGDQTRRSSSYFLVIPMSVHRVEPMLPWDAIGYSGRKIQEIIAPAKTALLQLVDGEGRQLGGFETVKTDIPNSFKFFVIDQATDADEFPEWYILDASAAVTTTVKYLQSGPSQVAYFFNEHQMAVTSNNASPNATDTLYTRPEDTYLQLSTGFADEKSLNIALESEIESRAMTVTGNLLAGTSISLQAAPDMQEALLSSDSDIAAYSLMIEQAGGTSYHALYSVPGIGAQDTQRLQIDWRTEVVTVEIDEGSNGTVDRTLVLAPSIPSNNQLYVPAVSR